MRYQARIVPLCLGLHSAGAAPQGGFSHSAGCTMLELGLGLGLGLGSGLELGLGLGLREVRPAYPFLLNPLERSHASLSDDANASGLVKSLYPPC